ncbi:hypothetical protein D9M68_918180 [compost metagenome]
MDGWFGCTGDLKDEAVLEFTVESDGKVKRAVVAAVLAGATTTSVAAAVAPRAGSGK